MWKLHNAETAGRSIHSPAEPAQFASQIRRSTWVRYPVDLDAVCCAPGQPEPFVWLAKVRSVWAKGFGFTSFQPLELGQVLWIRMQSKYRPLTRLLPVHVTHATYDLEGHWCINCEFARELDDCECAALL